MNILLIVILVITWFNALMSAEKIINTNINNPSTLKSPKKSEEALTRRVDINTLLNRARKVQEKETRTNFIFFGLIVSLVLVVGFLLSF